MKRIENEVKKAKQLVLWSDVGHWRREAAKKWRVKRETRAGFLLLVVPELFLHAAALN